MTKLDGAKIEFHQVSSETVRPRAPCGARCIAHAIKTWSAVCSATPLSQFEEEARPHLCMEEWNRPTAVRRQLSLTQAVREKLIPTGLTGPGYQNTKPGCILTILRVPSIISPLRNANAKSDKVVEKIPHNWHKWASGS